MKKDLHNLPACANFFSDAINTFFKGIFMGSIFIKNKPWESQLVPEKTPTTNFLPVNKNAMRNFTSTISPEASGSNKRFSVKSFLLRKGIFAVVLLLANLFLVSNVMGQNTGLQNPSTNSAVQGGGFSIPTRAYSSDNQYATAASGDAHQYGGFNFSIPSDAIISGIDVQVEGNRSGTSQGRRFNVFLSWDGGNNYSSSEATSNFTSSDATYIVGGSTDTWGRSWTATELNNTNFQVALQWATGSSGQINLDNVQARVYYTIPTSPYTMTSSGTFPVPSGVTCMKVEAWGAGGNGAGGSFNGAGGGSGAYVVNSSFSVTPNSNLDVVVGSAGSTNTSVGAIIAANGTNASGNTAGGPGSGSTGGSITPGNSGATGSGGTGGKGGDAPSGGTGGTAGQNGNSPGGGGGGSSFFGSGGSGANGAVKLSWVDISNFTTTATSTICGGTNAAVTLSSTSIAAGTYNVNYSTTNPVSTNNVLVTFTGTTTKTGSFTISGLTGPTSNITINSVGFDPSCGNVPQSNNTASVNVIASVGGTATATTSTICSGSGTTINLTGYTGSIQWQQSANGTSGWSPVIGGTGGTTASYTTPNLTTTTYYRAQVSNGTCGAANSTVVQVTVDPASVGGTATAATPDFCSGGTTTISLSGSIGADIQWQQSDNGTSNWVTVTGGSGGATTTYTTPNLTTTTYYRALLTSGVCASAISSVAPVTIITTPSITIQPTDQTITYGSPVTFTVTASGTSEPSYQWQVDAGLGFTNITGENSSTLTIANPTVAMSRSLYHVIIQNDCYTITSDDAGLTVMPATLTITADNQNKDYGSAFTFTGSEFSSTGLQNDETIGSVALTSTGAPAAAGVAGSPYAINASAPSGGTFDENNYDISYNAGAFTINKIDANIAVSPYSVVYDANPHSATITSATGVLGEDFTGSIVLNSTHTSAGTYNSDSWSFAGNSNYNPASGSLNNSISQRAITVTANPQTKIYGISDPALTYQVTSGALAGSDAFTGSLVRAVGESAGTYPISQGTLALSNDYNLGFIGDNLTITNIPIVGSANAGIVECAGGTTILTVTASGGDGTLQYSLNGGGYQSSNIFTVDAAGSPYAVTVEDADGFTQNTNTVTVIEKPSPTISLSSSAETSNQIICIGDGITGISYSIGGNITGATISPLPSGLTGTYDPLTQTFNITGTPDNPGSYSYTVTTAGPCANVSLGGTILVNDNATISPSTPIDQTVCINENLTNIIFNIGGGATNADVVGLPAGLTSSYDQVTGLFTISGSPTVSGSFGYTVRTYGPCDIPTESGTITVNANSSIVLSSVTGTDAQTVCSNSPITDIVYAIDDGATGAHVTGLPDGITGSYNAGTQLFTISGTPTQSPVQYGTFNYTVTTEGPCVNPSLTGSITINPVATVNSIGNQVICDGIQSAAVNFSSPTPLGGGVITYSWTNDNIAIGLPAAGTGDISAFTATNSGTIPIVGNITVTPHYTNNSITCDGVPVSFTITVNANSTISLASSNESTGQIVCINTGIDDIQYSIGGGATGAHVSGLPDGVMGSYNAGLFTISGTPTESGTFSYMVTTEGPCVNVSLGGSITVNANSTITLSSPANTDNQTVCVNTAISNITYSIGGGATSASMTEGSLPAGLTGDFSGGVFTISGTPTESGVFNYKIMATGPCIDAAITGTITVNPSPIVNPVSNATYCNNAGGFAINFTTRIPGGTVTYTWSSSADIGFGTTGNGNISSFTAMNITNSPVNATINVTPHYTNNMVTCDGSPVPFIITVNPTPVVNAVTNKTYCNNTQGEAINFSSPTTGGAVTYSWISSSNIGFGTTGSGNIPAYTTVNNSINPVTAAITVTPSANGCTGAAITFTITVNPSANAGTISGSSTLCINTTTQLSSNGSLGGAWTSSNPGVATVNATTGLVTSVSQGSTTIYYTVSNICGASSSSFTINVNSTANAGTISGPSTVCAGSSVVYTSNGNSGGLWFSANPTVATVNSAGVVTGVNGGTTTIYYYVSTPTCGSANTSANITVTSGGNPGIILGSSTMCAGSATVLITTGNSGGTWASTNPGVASIDPNNGFVIAQSAGSTVISYTLPSNSCSAGPLVAYFALNVNPSGNAGTISGNGTICVGSTTLLTSNGSAGGSWISGNNLVATVNPNTGVVTGVAPGNVLITYYVSNSCGNGSTVFPVSVSIGANAGALTGPSGVCVGSTINLISNGNPGGVWTSSNGNAIVDANGLVQGINAGTAVITYTVTSACSSSLISSTITINPVPVSGTISGAATVCAGLSTPFTSNGNGGGTWSSSNPLVASVNSSSGVVTGVASGSAIITYTVTTVCGTVNSSAPVTVNPVLNAGTISGGASVCMAGALQLSTDGSTGGQWTSSNTGVASVDANTGEVTPVSPGNTTIKYTVSNGCGTSTATHLVAVNALPTAGTVSGSGSVCVGASTAYSSNGNSGGIWTSSNPSVATVNPASGLVTGVADGTSIITYTVTTGCGTQAASAGITVNPLPANAVITGPNSVCVNSTINLSSNITGGTWHSNSPLIATISTSGQVSGVSGGNATITYTLATSCGSSVATYSVTVNTPPDAGFVPATSSTFCVGSSVFLTNVGGMPGGVWKSLNPGRASVNPSTGEVTCLSAGSTIIAYTVTNGCGTSSANLPVYINSLPNAGTVSGPSSVCVSSNINLTASGDAGGVWTSNNTLVATVDPNTGVVTGVAPGVASIIYTVGSPTVCGTSAASQQVTINPLANAGTISGLTTFCKGLSSNLTSNGSVGGTWSSSNPSVASVDPASGVVIGVGFGSAIINYTVTNICGSKTASVPVTINPLPDAGTVSGATSVCVGATINLSNNVSGGTWSSSTNSVATIDPNTGVVTGVGQGNTTISYTVTTSCGTTTANYPVTVNPVPNAGAITGTNYLCVGAITTWYSNIAGGSWSSSNTSAATVNSSTGVVTGVGAGTSTITYTVSSVCGISSQSAVVTIGDYPNAGTVSGASILCTGSTAIFASNGTGGGSWSSNNIAAATVDPLTGVVTGVAAGSATITYTVSSTCGSSSSSANITITALPNAGTVSGAASLCSGSLTTFNSNGTTGGTWSSNNNLVATVNPATGVVTGVGAGMATISYMINNTCGTATSAADITINALPNAGTVSGAATLCAESTTPFTSTGNGGGSWSSSDPSVASVDPVTGLVTGVVTGTATISYTVTSANCGSAVSSSNITIKPLPNPGLVNGATSVCVNATTTLTSSGSVGGTWSSDNTAIATVNTTTGMVTGISAGSTSITYTVTNGCGTAGSSWVITVDPLPNSGVVSGAATVCVNSTTTFTSDGLAGTWSSDNSSVATVDANSGLVTGIAPGNANIIYTVTTPCGTTTSSAPITVIILPDAGAVSGSSTVCVGSNTTYTSDGLSGGTWSSATPSVATVDPNTGEITGVASGNATITYTFTNSCGTSTASKTITVDPLPNAGTISGSATVCIGATVTYSSDGLSGGTWSSSNTSVATVDPNTGVITGVTPGNSTITYTSNTPCGLTTASADITVAVTPTAGTVSGSTTVCVGSTTTYTSNGLSGGTWSSDSPDRATVDPNTGVVTGVLAGYATIRYTFSNSCGTSSSSQLITVNPLPNAGTVTGASSVCVGSIATFSSNGLAGGAWSSSDPAVASVNATTGVVSGIAPGNATITYTSTTPCGTQTVSANITVNPVLTAGTVTGATTLCIGSTTNYISDGSAGGTWTSVTPSVATVDPNTGVVTGISTGNATIKYTVSSGCGTSTSSQMIAVSLAANPGTVSGPSSICTGSFRNFSHPGGVNGGVWSSSNTSVATVSNSGVVTGISGGSAVITYAVTSGCGSTNASQTVTVTETPSVTANNISVNTDPNNCSALINLTDYVTATGSSNLEFRIGYYFLSWPISSSHTFYRGTTPVTVIARNSCGTVARTFLVTVVDNEAPVIACKPNANRTVNGNSSRYSVNGHEFDVTATDGCGVSSLVYSLSGATTDDFDRRNTSLSHVKLNIGTTTITWKATDVNGNISTCSFTVTVTGNGNNFYRKTEDISLKVKAAPNPSSYYFTLQFESESKEKVNLTVVDVTGRAIEQMKGIDPNGTVQIGSKYRPGTYIVHAVQGNNTVSVKLIKEGKLF